MINAKSVKDRLKNVAQQEGRTMQDCLVSYALERTIYRLSVSEYTEHFVLKGGVFLYALFGRKFPRATIDIDLLARRVSNNGSAVTKIFKEVFSIECDDALYYDLDSVTVKSITEFKKYQGINVSVLAYLDRTRIPVSIDIGFGDSVYPECIEMEFPVILNMDAPVIYAYSIYSVIAEKFEAIVSLGLVNSRYKDFYDISQIAGKYDLNGKKLKEAIVETFKYRNTGFDDIVVFMPDFTTDMVRVKRWEAFVKKKKAMDNCDFSDVVGILKALLEPIVDSINAELPFKKVWNAEMKCWM